MHAALLLRLLLPGTAVAAAATATTHQSFKEHSTHTELLKVSQFHQEAAHACILHPSGLVRNTRPLKNVCVCVGGVTKAKALIAALLLSFVAC